MFPIYQCALIYNVESGRELYTYKIKDKYHERNSNAYKLVFKNIKYYSVYINREIY